MKFSASFIVFFFCFCVLTITCLEIKTVLNEDEIHFVKKHTGANDACQDDWEATYTREGHAMLPFAKHVINLKANGGDPKKVPISAFVSLVGHGGGTLQLLRLLKSEGYNVLPVAVVVNPKAKKYLAHYRACIGILKDLEVIRLKISDSIEDAEEVEEFSKNLNFESMNAEGILESLISAEILAVALCGGTFYDSRSIQPVLRDALKILPKLIPIGATDKLVIAPGTPSGRTQDGTWPIGNEHACTYVVTTTWPLKSAKDKKETNVLVKVPNSPGSFGTFFETLVRLPQVFYNHPNLLKDVHEVHRAEFTENSWVHITYVE